MTAPLYGGLSRPSSCPAAGNPGLWYTRFFDRYLEGRDWAVDETSKRGWIESAARHRPDGALEAMLQAGARRRIGLVRSCGGDLSELRTSWRFVTGLGLPHPVENGFAWHPTWGLPYLPATGVKGLLAAWLWMLSREDDQTDSVKEEAKERLRVWCGEQDDAGSLIFFDALPTAPPALAADVMTPHMGQWYAEGGGLSDPDREPQKVPADWHSPVPVPFLVVERATFLFGIAPRPGADWGERDPTSEVAAALVALAEALAVLGAGAKTAVGYGRFEPGGSILQALREAEAEAARTRAQAERRAVQLARFDGFDPPVIEAVGDAGLGGFATRLLAAMECGTWPREPRRQIAARLRDWLVERGDWVEDALSKSDKAGKDKKIKNTLEVLRWLER
jgi:CRISPR-associated protein Cmr6